MKGQEPSIYWYFSILFLYCLFLQRMKLQWLGVLKYNLVIVLADLYSKVLKQVLKKKKIMLGGDPLPWSKTKFYWGFHKPRISAHILSTLQTELMMHFKPWLSQKKNLSLVPVPSMSPEFLIMMCLSSHLSSLKICKIQTQKLQQFFFSLSLSSTMLLNSLL